MFRKEEGIYLNPSYDNGDYPIEIDVCDTWDLDDDLLATNRVNLQGKYVGLPTQVGDLKPYNDVIRYEHLCEPITKEEQDYLDYDSNWQTKMLKTYFT